MLLVFNRDIAMDSKNEKVEAVASSKFLSLEIAPQKALRSFEETHKPMIITLSFICTKHDKPTSLSL